MKFRKNHPLICPFSSSFLLSSLSSVADDATKDHVLYQVQSWTRSSLAALEGEALEADLPVVALAEAEAASAVDLAAGASVAVAPVVAGDDLSG